MYDYSCKALPVWPCMCSVLALWLYVLWLHVILALSYGSVSLYLCSAGFAALSRWLCLSALLQLNCLRNVPFKKCCS